jgi:aspartyl-tRNA(Asn)/glutamyl-tRNA(Gln) amidotransferase subunit C
MKITDKQIDDLAHLARLEFKDSEKNAIKNDLERIIEFCDVLGELDTEGLDPLIYLSNEKNILRPDEVGGHLDKEKVLRNAPLSDSDYIKVPKVKN